VYWLDEDSRARLVVLSLNGNIVKQLDFGEQGKGEHVDALDTNGLSAGIYYVALQTDKGFGFVTRKVFKVAKID
jgi:hypothetical protein